MSRTKGLIDGYWFYEVYDIDNHELIAQGKEKDCCAKLNQSINHYHFMHWCQIKYPNRKPRFEYVKREWIPYEFELTDTFTNQVFSGSKQDCRKWICSKVGKELTDANFNNYWYGSIRRFERKSYGSKG